MRLLQSIWLAGKTLAVAAACWVAVHGTALAEAAGEKEKGGGSWILSYALVLLGLGLGLLVIVRSSQRRDRAKPEQYDQRKQL